jgi:hypothetical protein
VPVPPLRLASRVLLSSALILISVSVAFAQASSIDVRVGAANAASAVVTAHAKDGALRSWIVKPDATGRASVQGLPAGVYQLTVDSSGAGQGAADVRVADREIATVDATLSAGKWALRVVERVRAGQGLVLDRNELEHLPSSMSAGSIIETTIPGPISSRVDGGGIGTGDPALFGSRGASWTTTSYRIGEMDVTNPARTGTPLFYPDLRMFESVGVTTGVAPVEFGQPGAAISLTPRRPGSERHGAVEGSFTTGGMASSTSSTTAPAIATLTSFGDGAFQWSGPITSRVGAFVMASHTQSKHVERGGTTELVGDATSLFTNIVAQLNDRSELRVVGSVQGVTRPYPGRAQFQLFQGADAAHAQASGFTEQDIFGHAQAAWDHHASNGARWLVAGAFSEGEFTPDVPASAPGGWMNVIFDGPMLLPPSDDVVTSWSARAQFEPRNMRTGGVSHSLRAGITFGRDGSSSHQIAAPTVYESSGYLGGDGVLWAWQPTPGDSHRHVTDVTGFADDRLVLSSKVTGQVGIRLEHATGMADSAAQGITWSTFSPRASVRWKAVGGLALTAAYGRYSPRLPLSDLAWGDPNGAWAKLYFGAVVPAQQLGRSGTGPTGAIDPSLKTPHTDEYVFGAEFTFNDRTSVRGSAIIRREKSLVNQTASGVTYSVVTRGDQGVDYKDPSDDRTLVIYNRPAAPNSAEIHTLTNPADDRARYEGIELELEHRGDALSMLVGVTAFRSDATAGGAGFGVNQNDQGVIGDTYSDPNMTAYAYGRPFFDRAYVLKWSTLYKGPHDIHATATVRYQDGQPFSRIVVAQGQSLTQAQIVPAFPNGLTRFSYLVTLDARLEKGFALGHGRRAAVMLDVFNLTNMANEVEEDPVSGASFRATTAVQPPRTVRLGFRFEF